MANVAIVKPPLYGTVEWNGAQFIYTPNPDFTGNDSYVYKITDETGTKVITKYVNPTNTPPVAKNITINVEANSSRTISILELVEDLTDPFDYLKITSISENLTRGYVTYDSSKITFYSDAYNAVETIGFTISDKQFETSGIITINVINGFIKDDYKGSPYARFETGIREMSTIKPLTGVWSSLASFLAVYGPIWDSIDANRYNQMASVVSGQAVLPSYEQWNTAYQNLSTYISLYNTVCANSGEWNQSVIDGTNIYNTLTSEILNYYSNYDTITTYNNSWSNNILALSTLSSISTKLGEYITSTNNTVYSISSNWDTTELNAFSAENFGKLDSLNELLSTVDNKNEFWNKNISNYSDLSSSVYVLSNNLDSTYNILTDFSANWDTNELNAFSAENFGKWNDTKDVVTSNYTDWNLTSYSSFSADYYDDNKFNSVVDTVSTLSGSWDTTYLNTFSAENFEKWDSNFSVTSNFSSIWSNIFNEISSLSTSYFQNTPLYTSLNDNVTSNTNTKWDRTIIQNVSSYIQPWEQVPDVLIDTGDNVYHWNNTHSLVSGFSGNFIKDSNNYASTSSTVTDNIINWSDTSTSSLLSSNSAYWVNTYDTLCGLSSNFVFDEKSSIVSLYTTITSNSGYWDNTHNKVNSQNLNWTSSYTSLTGISSQALTGIATTTMSGRNLAVYGNAIIAGNLSALGKKITIDTNVSTTSSIVIENQGTTNAMVVNKVGGFDNAILNLNAVTPTLTSNVLYVKTTNSVGVNLSSFDTSNALTVSGNISASGAIYPLNDAVTTFISNSSKYISTYNILTSLSSDFTSYNLVSANYNNMKNLITLSSSVIADLTANIPKISALYANVSLTSAYNDLANQHVSLCAGEYGKDSLFRNDKPNLDTFYNNVTSISSIAGGDYNINILFSYKNKVSAVKIPYTVEDNIKINGWTVTANKNSVVVIDILSSDYATYGSGVLISPNNKPRLDISNPIKHTSSGVSFWTRDIAKNSILEFNMTNYTSGPNLSSDILLSLNVSKQ